MRDSIRACIAASQELSGNLDIAASQGVRLALTPYMDVDAPELVTLFTELKRSLKTQLAVAQAIGLSQSQTSRLIRGEVPSLGVMNCLRLAKVAGRSPSVVLRAAGKEDVAALMEELYGRAPTPPRSLSEEALQVARDWMEIASNGNAEKELFWLRKNVDVFLEVSRLRAERTQSRHTPPDPPEIEHQIVGGKRRGSRKRSA